MGKAPKRPRDPNHQAKLIADIARGEVEEREASATVRRASKAGIVGGPARAKALMSAQRSEIASIAAAARWKMMPSQRPLSADLMERM